MAKYKFPYDSLRWFRKNRLLLAKKEMIKVEDAIHQLQITKTQCQKHVSDLLSEAGTEFDIAMRPFVGSYQSKIALVNKEILTAEEDLKRHQSWIAHLGKELKIIDKLEDKRRDAFEAEQKLAEKKREDAWVTENWGRGKDRA